MLPIVASLLGNGLSLIANAVCKLVYLATRNGFVLTGGELERKVEMQEIYIRTGRSNKDVPHFGWRA